MDLPKSQILIIIKINNNNNKKQINVKKKKLMDSFTRRSLIELFQIECYNLIYLYI